MLTSQYKVPFVIGCVMLLLGFIGMVLTDVRKDGAWSYWVYVVFIYAALSLAYNLYSKGKESKIKLFTFWHEVFHWVGLFLCVSLICFMVRMGMITRFLASLEILVLLGLTTYLIGVYFDKIFIPIGIVLGLFAASIALFDKYLYLISIPLLVIGIGILIWIVHQSDKTLKE